jgi:hypothetical protein
MGEREEERNLNETLYLNKLTSFDNNDRFNNNRQEIRFVFSGADELPRYLTNYLAFAKM